MLALVCVLGDGFIHCMLFAYRQGMHVHIPLSFEEQSISSPPLPTVFVAVLVVYGGLPTNSPTCRSDLFELKVQSLT